MSIEERRAKVAELSKAGKSERQIAAELGVSRTTVWTDKQVVARGREELKEHPMDEPLDTTPAAEPVAHIAATYAVKVVLREGGTEAAAPTNAQVEDTIQRALAAEYGFGVNATSERTDK
jgi:hypothetical protein